MSLNHRDIKNIQTLANEGKEPGLVYSENYPKENRQDIYDAYYKFVKSSPHASRISIGQIISILRIPATDKEKLLLDDLDSLSSQLFKTLRSNQQKLDNIRRFYHELQKVF
jgi:N-glycosylase/DNA lyase